jgi:hypothetical protein
MWRWRALVDRQGRDDDSVWRPAERGSESCALVESVKKDQMLYFTVDPKAECSCDGTMLRLVISRGDAD